MSEYKKKAKLTLAEVEDEKLMSEYGELVLDCLKTRPPKTSDDPFATYALDIRSHFYESISKSRNRFVKGYKALLEEIEKECNQNQ